MQKALIILLFLLISTNGFSQNYDLIVTTEGDSIACRIYNITDTTIYIKMKRSKKWVNIYLENDKVAEYKYKAVDKYMVSFKPGSTFIDVAYNQSDVELMHALKLKKSGKTVAFFGGMILITSGLILTSESLNLDDLVLSFLLGVAGTSTLAVGVSMRLTGKKRVKQICFAKNSASGDILLSIKPHPQYNKTSQNFQFGLTFKISF